MSICKVYLLTRITQFVQSYLEYFASLDIWLAVIGSVFVVGLAFAILYKTYISMWHPDVIVEHEKNVSCMYICMYVHIFHSFD
jgi:hypothetical protein